VQFWKSGVYFLFFLFFYSRDPVFCGDQCVRRERQRELQLLFTQVLFFLSSFFCSCVFLHSLLVLFFFSFSAFIPGLVFFKQFFLQLCFYVLIPGLVFFLSLQFFLSLFFFSFSAVVFSFSVFFSFPIL
jgi:hypothetical protein